MGYLSDICNIVILHCYRTLLFISSSGVGWYRIEHKFRYEYIFYKIFSYPTLCTFYT